MKTFLLPYQNNAVREPQPLRNDIFCSRKILTMRRARVSTAVNGFNSVPKKNTTNTSLVLKSTDLHTLDFPDVHSIALRLTFKYNEITLFSLPSHISTAFT